VLSSYYRHCSIHGRLYEKEICDVCREICDVRRKCVTCTGCDARVLIEKEPASFLASSDDSIQGMAQKYQVLQERLVGVDVCELLHEQPCLVCMDIVRGIDQLFQLWDVDTRWVVLRNSYPDELALALRALSEEA
jgi:hypothetical protein